MRSFLFTVLLFALMLCAVIANTIFIHRLSRDMLDLIDRLPDTAEQSSLAQLDSLAAQWQDARNWVELSVNRGDINRISDQLISLCVFCEHGETADYITAREELRLAIEDLREFEIPFSALWE